MLTGVENFFLWQIQTPSNLRFVLFCTQPPVNAAVCATFTSLWKLPVMVFSVPPRKSTAFFFEHLVRDLQVCSAVYVLSWKTAVIQKDKGVALILYILPRGSITFLRRMAVELCARAILKCSLTMVKFMVKQHSLYNKKSSPFFLSMTMLSHFAKKNHKTPWQRQRQLWLDLVSLHRSLNTP